MSEVVSFHDGSKIAHPGEPDGSVVEELERLLEMARAGEVIGVAYSVEHFDGANNNRYVGRVSRKLLGGLMLVMHRLSNELNNA